jgi:hypothetical protein
MYSIVADRLRQSGLLHFPINVGNDLPRDLQPIFAALLLHNINTDSAENLFSVPHNAVPTEDANQAFAEPGPEGGPIFVTTSTSSNVAV